MYLVSLMTRQKSRSLLGKGANQYQFGEDQDKVKDTAEKCQASICGEKVHMFVPLTFFLDNDVNLPN